MIVWLSSYPRSGNTLLRTAIHQVYGVKTRDLYFPNADPTWTEEMKHAASKVGFESMPSFEELDSSDEICFIKTHELPTDVNPAIYVIRDGRDALTSYAHFILATEMGLQSGEDSEEYKEKFLATLWNLVTLNESFGGWSEHILSWSCRHATTSIVRYEDMLNDPVRTIEIAIKRLGLDKSLTKQTDTFSTDNARLSLPQHFRKGKVGSFRQEMPPDIEREFWKHHGEVMRLMGYRNTSSDNLLARFLKPWNRAGSKAA